MKNTDKEDKAMAANTTIEAKNTLSASFVEVWGDPIPTTQEKNRSAESNQHSSVGDEPKIVCQISQSSQPKTTLLTKIKSLLFRLRG